MSRDNNTEFHKEEGKPMLDLLHINALTEEGRVCSYGARKYGLRNWEEHADKWTWGQLIASTLRHIFRWMIGEDFDEESGLHHLAHARWNLGAVYELQLAGKGTDDRSKMQKTKCSDRQVLVGPPCTFVDKLPDGYQTFTMPRYEDVVNELEDVKSACVERWNNQTKVFIGDEYNKLNTPIGDEYR